MAVDMNTNPLPNGPAALCFDKDIFMKDEFNVDQFVVECRRRVALETLQEDLNIYLKTLQNAMIELINKDYADFVNLSTNLVGLDKAINNLTTPLGQLREEVLNVQGAMDEAIEIVQNKLNLQAKIRNKKANLQRLLNIAQCVLKMEKLLGIDSGNDSPYYPSELNGQLIERVATEFNKLQFYVNKSRGLPLVDNIRPRISAITSTLQYSLEGSFKEGLVQNDTDVLRRCLRTYAIIYKMADAENLFRQHTVKPYMEEVITEQFINDHPQGLSGMYSAILDFIPLKCKCLKDITSGGMHGRDMVRGYDFLVNAVWPEVVANIEARTPSIFAPGNPKVFHQKYSTSIEFVETFEKHCGSQASIKRLRSHPSYNTFMSKWSLPVYFQIRFQEVAGSFENTLVTGMSPATENTEGLHTSAAQSAFSCIQRCWESDVLLLPLCHRFWKLTLQILARLNSWVQDVRQTQLAGDKQKDVIETDTTTKSEADELGVGPITEMQESKAQPVTMTQIVKLIADIHTLSSIVPTLYETGIKAHLQKLGIQSVQILEDSLKESCENFQAEIPAFGNYIVEDISHQSLSHVKLVSDIPRLYRRTNREIPSKSSGYVNSAFKPISSFVKDHESTLLTDLRISWTTSIVNTLTEQYLTTTNDVLTSVKKMEESLKRLKRGKASQSVGGMSDDDKIRLQLYLDVQEYGKQIEGIGLNRSDIEQFTQLEELVTSAKNGSNSSS